MNKRMKKFAIASVVTLFSTNVLSVATLQNLHLGNNAGVVRAEEPPADEDVPSGAEVQLINEARTMLEDVRSVLAENDLEFAKELFEEFNHTALKNIPKLDVKAPGLLAEIEKLRGELYGTAPTPTPTPVTKTEAIPVTTRYEADPNLDYGQQTTKQGIPGEKTWTETNGVKDAGSEKVTKEMVPTVVKVGTKTKVETVTTPAPTGEVLENNSNLDKGVKQLKTAAAPGSKTVTTTYTLVSSTSADVTTATSESNVVPGTQAVYYIGTKEAVVTPTETIENIVERETVAVTTTRVANPNMYEGEETRTLGVAGTDLVTYKVYKLNGVETKREEVSRVHEKAMVQEVVEYGTKKKPVTAISEIKVDEPIKFTSRTEENPNFPKGTRNVKIEGKDGIKTVTYAVTTVDGVETERVKTGEIEKVAPVQEVIEIGTKEVIDQPWTPIIVPEVKSETTTEVIKFTSRTEENPNLPKGTRNVKIEGKDGLRTVVYTVTTVDGKEVKRVVASDTTTPAIEEVIEVGTKVEPVPQPRPNPEPQQEPTPVPQPKDGQKPAQKEGVPEEKQPESSIKPVSAKAENQKTLPQTGEQGLSLAAIGAVLLTGLAGWRKKKN